MRKLAAFLAFILLLLAGDHQPQAKGLWTWNGSSWKQGGAVAVPKFWNGAGWQSGSREWVWASGAWQPYYSIVTVSASNTSNSGSGASSTGTVSAGTTASVGGFPIGSTTVAWLCTTGPCPFINNSTIVNPTFSDNFSTGCQSSFNRTSLWRVTATDPATGAQAVQNNISVSLTWNNTTSCLGPFSVNASGSNGSGSGFSNTYQWTGTGTVNSFGGGPVSGNMSYSWTYVSGDTGSITSGQGTSSAHYQSSTQTCGHATTCNNGSRWNVHVIDLNSGYSADAVVDFFYQYTNDSG